MARKRKQSAKLDESQATKRGGSAEGPTTDACSLNSPALHSSSESASPTDKSYYLMKSEPESRMEGERDMKFSIDDLMARPNQTSHWDGVRNYQARNFMQKMRLGDLAFFYHSNCKTPGVVGIVKIVKEAYPDHTAWDKDDPHYDPASTEAKPRWFMVDVQFVRKLNRLISLNEIKAHPKLTDMALVKRSRLSVQPVSKDEWDVIVALEDEPGP